jgi:hypothetical protein
MRIGVPFFRPDLSGGEISEVVATLKSGWLTTGPRVKRFEKGFAPLWVADMPLPSTRQRPPSTCLSRHWD